MTVNGRRMVNGCWRRGGSFLFRNGATGKPSLLQQGIVCRVLHPFTKIKND